MQKVQNKPDLGSKCTEQVPFKLLSHFILNSNFFVLNIQNIDWETNTFEFIALMLLAAGKYICFGFTIFRYFCLSSLSQCDIWKQLTVEI